MNGARIRLTLSDHRSCKSIVWICLGIVDEFANGAITHGVENDLRLAPRSCAYRKLRLVFKGFPKSTS